MEGNEELSGTQSMLERERNKTVHNSKVKDNMISPLELTVGSRVLLQSQRTKEWNYPGKIVAVRPGGRSAFVEVNGGSTILRNRRYLKMDPAYILSEADISAALSLLSAVVQPTSILKKAGPRRAISHS